LAGQQAQEGWVNLIFFTALLSINLGILNLLPIPILDGGHIFFFLVESILRRPLSLKSREVAQQVGMFVLILLMVFVFYNDLIRVFSK
jgi:regulator of sigma E protease